jgi:hypothetical protein
VRTIKQIMTYEEPVLAGRPFCLRRGIVPRLPSLRFVGELCAPSVGLFPWLSNVDRHVTSLL